MSTTTEVPVSTIFAAIDAMRADEFASYFAESGRFRFGNLDTVTGRQAVADFVGAFFATLGGLRHDITGIWNGTWEDGEVVSVEAYVTYTRPDGSQTPPLPATSTLRMRNGEIQDYRIFIDVAPLYS